MNSFWLILEQQWTIEEISIFSNNSHHEWRAVLSDTILKGTHPRSIPARLCLIWLSGFRGEDLNVKDYDVRRTEGRRTPSDGKSSHGLWSGELINIILGTAIQHIYQQSRLPGMNWTLVDTMLQKFGMSCTRYGLNSFRDYASKTWNELPDHYRKETISNQFKSLINSWNGSSCHCSFCAWVEYCFHTFCFVLYLPIYKCMCFEIDNLKFD